MMTTRDPAYSTYYSVLFALLIGLNILTVIWSYADAERRGKSGCLVALLVCLFPWPLGWIIWLIFRPGDGAIKARGPHPTTQSVTSSVPFRATGPMMFCDVCGNRLIETDEGIVCPQCSSAEEL
jgi:hypothetical protein